MPQKRVSKPRNTSQPSPAVTAPSAIAPQVANLDLNFPEFDPNASFASDLATDSSAIARTPKQQADESIQAISERRETVRIIKANLELNKDVVQAGIAYQRLIGAGLDYAIAAETNVGKGFDLQTAQTQSQIAQTKLHTVEEKLTQAGIELEGTRDLTSLLTEEWQAKKELKTAKIRDLQNQVYAAMDSLQIA